MKRAVTGQVGEQAAAVHLERSGHRIVERNYRCTYGEIDLVAEEGSELAFVEVRTRSGTSFGSPEESITWQKKQRMTRCALAYLSERQVKDRQWRIDLIAVKLERGRVTRLEHYRHALRD
jgi:putative endonuclease